MRNGGGENGDCGTGGIWMIGLRGIAFLYAVLRFNSCELRLKTGSATVAPCARNGATCLPQLPQKIASSSHSVLQPGQNIDISPSANYTYILPNKMKITLFHQSRPLSRNDMEHTCQ